MCERLKCWLDDVKKNYVLEKTLVCCKNVLKVQTTDSKEDTEVNLQKAVIESFDGLHNQGHYDLRYQASNSGNTN